MKTIRVFFDVDTQNDFMNKDGALYVPNAEDIKPNLKLLTDYARGNRIHVLGSVDRHFGTEEYKERETELQRYGGPFPDHCMNGSVGELKTRVTTFFIGGGKAADTVLGDRYDDWGIYIEHPLKFEVESEKDIYKLMQFNFKLHGAVEELKAEKSEGIIYFEKQTYDVFTNPATAFVLENANVKEAVVYGVATDFCVKAAVLGLQKRNVQCYLVEDAIKGVFPDQTKEALEEMTRAGARLVTTKDVLEGRV